ncbi:hypothetical protein ACIPUC_14795 [Streptomyces sp. LARHCF249]
MGKYTQAFTLRQQGDPDEVWLALQKTVDDMDGAKLGSVDDHVRTLEFSTGATSTSWGQELQARVEAGPHGGSEVHVRGNPKGTFLTTKWGEKVHADKVRRHLSQGIAAAVQR